MASDTIQAPGMGLDAASAGPLADSAEEFSPPGHQGPWMPTTVRDVEWALERIGEAEADIAEVQAQLDAAIAALRDRAMAITEEANRRAIYLRGLVEGWAVQNRDQVVRGKVKSRELLGGTIGFRARPEKVVVRSPAALLAWAEPDHVDLVRVKTEIDKSAINAFVKSTGEIPPGVDVEPAGETITITVNPLPVLGANKKGALP